MLQFACMHIYPKMSDQTVNSICAFIISNDDTDFLIKL